MQIKTIRFYRLGQLNLRATASKENLLLRFEDRDGTGKCHTIAGMLLCLKSEAADFLHSSSENC